MRLGTLRSKFLLLLGVLLVGFVIFGVWSFYVLQELRVNGPVYERIVQGKDLIADILPPPEYIIESYLVSMQFERATDKAEQDALVTRLKALKADYDTRHEFWLKETLEPGLKDIFLTQA